MATAAEIRAEMARQKISAATLSVSAGITPATLSRKLNGLSGFSLDELLRVANSLGISAADLIERATTAAGAA